MCSQDDCENEVHARGLCQNHYRQMRRRERGLKKPGPKPDPDAPYSRHNPEGKRAPSEVEGGAEVAGAPEEPVQTHCKQGHEFTDENTYVDKKGWRHCRTCRRERSQKYRAKKGITKNPGIGTGGVNAAKTHCPRGHEYTDENTYTYNGSRFCRECGRLNMQVQNRKRYGYDDLDEYMEDLAAQGHQCAICGVEFDEDTPPHVDHDHDCCGEGRACDDCRRGLLCFRCNSAIGLINDDPDLLEAALSYLTTTG